MLARDRASQLPKFITKNWEYFTKINIFKISYLSFLPFQQCGIFPEAFFTTEIGETRLRV